MATHVKLRAPDHDLVVRKAMLWLAGLPTKPPRKMGFCYVWCRHMDTQAIIDAHLGGSEKGETKYTRHIQQEVAKEKARKKLYNAVKSGRMVRQPCEECGATPTEGHHDDYEKPLEVRWLCKEHHIKHHRQDRNTCSA